MSSRLASPRSSSSILTPRRTAAAKQSFEYAFAVASPRGTNAGSTAPTVFSRPKGSVAPSAAATGYSSPASTVVAPSPFSATFNPSASSSSAGANGPPAGSSLFDLKSKILSLKSTLSTRDATVARLENELGSLRSQSTASLSSLQARHDLEKSQEKAEYEAALARQQDFIESLITSKEDLNKQLAALSEKLLETEASYNAKFTALQDATEVETKRRMDTFLAGEKARRDAWIKEKTKQIRATTIKGLEPEIEKLMAQNKSNLEQAERNFATQFQRQAEEHTRETERLLTQLRATLLSEREEALENERQASHRRLAEAQQRSDAALDAARTRMHEALDDQAEKFLAEREAARPAEDSLRAQYEERIKALKVQHVQDLVVERQRSEAALSLQKLQLQTERQKAREALDSAVLAAVKEREEALRSNIEKQHGEEIAHLTQRMAQEQNKLAEELTAKHQEELAVLQRKLAESENRAKSGEGSSAAARAEAKLALTLEQLADARATIDKQRREIDRKAEEIKALQARLARLDAGSDAIRTELESKYSAQLSQLTSERDSLKQSVRDERDRFLDEKRRIEKVQADRVGFLETKHAGEIDSLNLRVRHMLEKKDLVIGQLKAQIEESNNKIQRMERLLDQRVNEVMGNE
jgi:5-azacytidine-induced protein 1